MRFTCSAPRPGGWFTAAAVLYASGEGRWQPAAIFTMMRFSRVGHYAVAGVLLTGIINTLFIVGINVPWHAPYVQLLLFKCALVMMMVAIALANRYFLVPRFARRPGGNNRFYQDDTGRGGAGRAGTGGRQPVRDREPF